MRPRSAVPGTAVCIIAFYLSFIAEGEASLSIIFYGGKPSKKILYIFEI
jgi:hypothetical protein